MAELRAALQAAKRAHAIADSRAYDGNVVRYMLDEAEQQLRDALMNSPDGVAPIADQPEVAHGVITRVNPHAYYPPLRGPRVPLAAFRPRTRSIEPSK